MKKAIKWLLITVGVFIALVIVAIIVIPMFVDIQKYKPDIEQKISEATGRPFTIRGDLNLSLFPWVGISFSNLHVGNPPGFQEKDLLSVAFFEARVRLIPLLFRNVHVKRFVLEEPRIVLEKSRNGQVNWEGIGKSPAEETAKPSDRERKATETLLIKGLAVGEFAVTKGSILWIDGTKGERKKISDITLRLEDISVDRPVRLAFSANLDGNPLALKGNAGPVGTVPGKGTFSIDLTFKALEAFVMGIKGDIIDPATRQEFDLAIQVSPFSPRKLITALGKDFSMPTADPDVLNLFALKARLQGNPRSLSVSEGNLDLDDSKLNFTADIKDFSKPNMAFDLTVDKIDLDRYLPSPGEKRPAEKQERTQTTTSETKKTDYIPLRNLILDGKVTVKELKARGARIQDLSVRVSSKNGLFRLDPLTLKLYRGNISSTVTFDVRKDTPTSTIALQAKGIQVNPLLKDLFNKDFLEGTVQATLDVAMTGDDAKKIKSTLHGKGDLLFNDGAIKGIDLAGMVRNAAAAFGLAERGGEKPRTDFSELHAPCTITRGIVDTARTSLSSPLLRVMMAGKADLVKEILDFRVEPTFVGTLKGQGDTKQRAGITVPVLITGRFSSPQFRPDLKGMFQQKLETVLPTADEGAKNLLKRLPAFK